MVILKHVDDGQTTRQTWKDLPQPPARFGSGHLLPWTFEPLKLLHSGFEVARQHHQDLFALKVGLPAVVGFSPAWNKRLLTDLNTFGSARSLSMVVPYLAGGIILTDAPQHAPRRQMMNPSFSKAHLLTLQQRIRAAIPALPNQEFDALAWADKAVLQMLNAAYFSSQLDADLLHQFLAPLRQPFPSPALARPHLFLKVTAEIRRLGHQRLSHASEDDLLALLAPLAGGLSETRVSLAAAHDTTTHALAYAIWHLAQYPQWHTPEHHGAVLKETLRFAPPGWMGSRRLRQAINWNGTLLPKGTLALYSPYLSARDPQYWDDAHSFKPQRWQNKPPAWAYLPFGGGERLCLGMHLAQMIILEVLATLPKLRALRGNDAPKPALTLGPTGPLVVVRQKANG